MLGALQPIHWIVVLFVVLIIFGPGKLPDVGRALGKGIRDFKKETVPEEPEVADPPKAAAVSTAPIVLVQGGQTVPAGLSAANMSETGLRSILAERGYSSLDQISMLIRQADGNLQVYQTGSATPVTLSAASPVRS